MNKSHLVALFILASFAYSIANAQTAAAADKAAAAPVPTPAPSLAPPPDAPVLPADALLSDFAYSGGNTDAEVVPGVQKGMKVYKDNDVTFPDLPAYLTGVTFIRPYMADAAEGSSTDQYQLNVTKYCHVYLAIDSANDMPANNDNETYKWEKLTDTIMLNKRPMTLYKSRLMAPYDVVYLATNGHGIDKFDPKSNMYLLFIKSEEMPLIKPGLTVTASSSKPTNAPALALDDDPKTYWQAADVKTPPWIKVDLGQKSDIGGYDISWTPPGPEVRTFEPHFVIEVSDDDKTYSVSLDQKTKPASPMGELRVPPLNVEASQGRYVRITVTSGPASISELKINGLPAPAPEPAATDSGKPK